jgi:hypothetical protein
MISQEMIYDAQFNALSVEAQLLFVRMLAVTDDCGVLPADTYELTTLTNPPKKLRTNLDGLLGEIRGQALMEVFEYGGKRFLMFKRESFDAHQSYLLNKRTRSEYLKMGYEDFVELSKTFQEVPRNYAPVKQKAESRKQQVVSSKNLYGEFKNVALTAEEMVRLVARLGSEEKVGRGIEILSAYKESKGKTYKSDYAAFTTWVVGELEKREAGNGQSNRSTGSGRGRERHTYTQADIDASVVPPPGAGR